MSRVVAIVPAAGLGQRMGGDKALLDLDGTTALERLAGQVRACGVEELVVVRREDAAALPAAAGASTVTVSGSGDMAESLRAAERALPADCTEVLICPVDHALVQAETFAAVLGVLRSGDASIVLPIHREQVGHPIAMQRAVFAEIQAAGVRLRDVVRKDRERVAVVPSANPWIVSDLDRPEDLRAARAALAGTSFGAVEQMLRHRSHRSYHDKPLADGQLERLVEAARHASTSSFIQAYSVVAVQDPQRRKQVAALCGNQPHIEQAAVFTAICADLHKIDAACEGAGKKLQSSSFELFLQSTVDAALLGQNLALAAEAEGLGICMIGAARNQPIEIAELLGLPKHVFVVFGMTIGHPEDDPVPRGRMPLEGVLHRERYDVSRTERVLQGADEGMRDWARRANAEQGGYMGRPVNVSKGWRERMARSWGSNDGYVAARAALNDCMRRLGFDLFSSRD